ncbi:site-2 protease family protein [Archaeoglobus profundus]|uniref:Peptidase M50 n=1 Tax=Archaeoglobus profundus (strain DSM 5631 / JCM 9629 / NBRC 100127 / Av18) TaxID=572546 RepID=D2RHH8_ARCPA|nr:site-2 protease family protein [Archaeoglobus profundus]ADB57753.1 peptidase M50 [Archaeoglobus profundus DSM 5631]
MKDTLRREIERFAIVYHVEEKGDVVRFHLQPIDFEGLKRLLEDLTTDYDVRVNSKLGQFVIELKRYRERIWINLVLLIATFASTTVMGAGMFERFDLIGGITYSVAIMFVLGFHEMGHYIFARKWGMRTSLPYFIPFPSIIGTLGAVIKHRGRIPNRKALFDVGVSGPLFGIFASMLVTYIGLKMEFKPIYRGEFTLMLGTPPLFEAIARLAGFNGTYIHPVAFAGWVGMFVTFLNLIPVGQLDGGHILRAMIGEMAEDVYKILPIILIILGLVTNSSLWLFWGFITMFFAMQRHPKPMVDEPIDLKRYVIGILTFALGLACFTPHPFSVTKG